MPTWDPAQYNRFAAPRARPFHDLVARIGTSDPGHVVDLGCGPGTLTATLLDRWPGAIVTAVDSSLEMLAAAAPLARPPRLTFQAADITTWQPDRPADVLVCNAVLQWIPDHPSVLRRFVSMLSDGGWLAFQVPGNFDAPSHHILRRLREAPRWHSLLGTAAVRDLVNLDPAEYLDLLVDSGCVVDAWETTYLHVLPGADPVLDWYRGTGLRPVLEALEPPDAARFTAEYGAALRVAYPARPYGTVLPFRRIFVVAQKVTQKGYPAESHPEQGD